MMPAHNAGTDNKISCTVHGEGRLVATCQHIVQQFNDKIPSGANWNYFEDEDSFEVFCDKCNEMLCNVKGPIPESVKQKMGHAIICEQCIDQVLALNSTTRSN